jgi:WD40 repeat protein
MSMFIRNAILSPDGREALTLGSDNVLRVWDIESKEVVGRIRPERSTIAEYQYRPDGRQILVLTRGGLPELWSSRGYRIAQLDSAAPSRVCIFSANSELLLTISKEGQGQLWDRSGKLLRAIENGGEPILSASFSNDGRRVLICTEGKKAIVCSTETGSWILDLKATESRQ